LREQGGSATIGRPISNSQVYILDSGYRPVPIGVPGEIYIAGDGLARGYLYRPEATAERFVPDLFSRKAGSRMYRTGDLARYRPDGNIEFLGRLDHQVKIRGYRIELGEIEARLSEHPAVRDVVVVAREDGGDKRLVGYWVSRNSEPEPDLREYLRSRLPDCMIPSVFMRLEVLPQTPNGKVDRKALPSPEADRASGSTYAAPRDDVERRLAELWSKLLGVKEVGIHDNFFALGGHSLLATRLTSRMRETFHVDVSVRSVFEASTLADLAEAVRTAAMPTNEDAGVIRAEVEEGSI